MQLRQTVGFSFLCFVLATQTLHASCSRPVDVAFSSISPDMTLSASGKHEGVAVDFLNEISARSGCAFNYVDMPRARAWYLWSRMGTDIVPSAVNTAERDQSGRFFSHEVYEPISLLSLKLLSVTSSKDLLDSTLTVGVVRGYNLGPRYSVLIDQLAAAGRLVVMKDPQTLARMLKARRMEAVLLAAGSFAEAAEEVGISQQLQARAIDDLDWTQFGMYLSNTRLSVQDQQALTAAIEQLNHEGFYAQKMRLALRGLPQWATSGMRFQRPAAF
jgi:hypothetical protein